MSTLSVLGLFNWDNSLFDGLELPSNCEEFRENLIDTILLECAEIEILYTDFDYMKFAIESWSKKQAPVWEKLQNTTMFEYDPIANYDRTEEWTDSETAEGGDIRTPNLKRTSIPATINILSRQGFNQDGFVPAERNELSGRDETSETGTETSSGSFSSTKTRSGRAKGNIGVTTTQQMITQERDVVTFNIVNHIVEEFKMRFCLLVY